MKKTSCRIFSALVAAVLAVFTVPVYAIGESDTVENTDNAISDIQNLDESQIMDYDDFIEAYDNGYLNTQETQTETTIASDDEQLVNKSQNITQYNDTTETPVYKLVSAPSITWYSSDDTEFLKTGMEVTATYESTGEVVDITSQCTFDWESPAQIFIKGFTSCSISVIYNGTKVGEFPVNIGILGDVDLDLKITTNDASAVLLNCAKEVSGQTSSLSEFQKYLGNVDSFTRGQNAFTTSDASLILFWCASSAANLTFSSWQEAQTEQIKQAAEAVKREEEANKQPDPPVVVQPTVNVKGIDVSRWQGAIDWAKVKEAGIEYVMVRAGYGMFASQEDDNFDANINGAKAAGVKVGVYWYSYATSAAQAEQEAAVCLEVIRGYKLDYPVMFDIEDPSQTGLGSQLITDMIVAFCSKIESAGYYCGIYSYKNFLESYVTTDVRSRFDIWLAQWASTPTYSGSYGMWQYTSGGAVNGISGRVDMDIAYKDYPAIMKSRGLNGY